MFNNALRIQIPQFILNKLNESGDKAKSDFIIGIWNGFFSFILPAMISVAGLYLTSNDLALKVSSFLSIDFLDYFVAGVVSSVLGSLIYGGSKSINTSNEIKEFSDSEGLE